MNKNKDNMSEKELRAEISVLEKVIRCGEATVMQAHRLAELRNSLEYIQVVKGNGIRFD